MRRKTGRLANRNGVMKIQGRIVFEDLEGGLWGIIDDHGRRFQPIDGLPPRFRIEGLRVSAHVEPTGMASSAMWGNVVRVHDIASLDR